MKYSNLRPWRKGTATGQPNDLRKGPAYFAVRPRVSPIPIAKAAMLLIGCSTEASVSVPAPDAVRIGGTPSIVVGDSFPLTATVFGQMRCCRESGCVDFDKSVGCDDQ